MRFPGLRLVVAMDVEFIRVEGVVMARSVAFVPLLLGCTHPQFHHAHAALSRQGDLTPKVVQLTPDFVLQQGDILPCGHISSEVIQHVTHQRHSTPDPAVSCSADDLLFSQLNPYGVPNITRYGSLIRQSMAWRGEQTLAASTRLSSPTTSSEASTQELERLLLPYTEAKIRKGKRAFMDVLHTYNHRLDSKVGVVRRQGDDTPLADDPLMHLLTECHGAVKEELHRCASAVHSSPLPADLSSTAPQLGSACGGGGGTSEVEVSTHEDYLSFAMATAQCWNRFLAAGSVSALAPFAATPKKSSHTTLANTLPTQFLSYGSEDVKVINATLSLLPTWGRRGGQGSVRHDNDPVLQWLELEKNTGRQEGGNFQLDEPMGFGQPSLNLRWRSFLGLKSGNEPDAQRRKDEVTDIVAAVQTAVPYLEEYMSSTSGSGGGVKVVDITGLQEFRSVMQPVFPKSMPGLVASLKTMANTYHSPSCRSFLGLSRPGAGEEVEPTARAKAEKTDNHNPLWDAAALALIAAKVLDGDRDFDSITF